MNGQKQIEKKVLDWLFEVEDPGVRYLALRDLCQLSEKDEELRKARQAAHREGPIAAILDNMKDEGCWVEPGPGYNPKYSSTVWTIILLAQLGATIEEDPRIERACRYLVAHSLAHGGQFSIDGAPSGTIDCLQGNLCWALIELGYKDDRVDTAFEWMARTVTGEGIAPMTDRHASTRYYAGKCGPLFACGANNKLACAWGGIKVMLAFSQVPAERRAPLITRAIEQGAEFLLAGDPARADYPNGWSSKPSQNWWKFGFPVFYVTDLLQNVEALVRLGYGSDPRLKSAWEIIASKQDSAGRWPLEYDYAGKTWGDFGKKKLPSKWVTLRALRVLQKEPG
jgi:hypothetical protein